MIISEVKEGFMTASPLAQTPNDMFNAPIAEADPEIAEILDAELSRQQNGLEMIASENFVPRAVLQAQGSVLTNKYAEGYPGRRYYGGCEQVDKIETIARERAKSLFGAEYANVQPHSGAQANAAVYQALVKPGDTVLGLALDHGGHLTHGMKINFSGRFYHAEAYGVNPETFRIDPEIIRQRALETHPAMIIGGWSAYPRIEDFKAMKEIADEVGAKFWVDMAHFAGLVAAGLHPSPVPYADVVSSTAHKTLGGPRSGFILAKQEYAKKLNSAVFPGQQGGPLMHVIAGKAVAFGEAMQPAYKEYIDHVVENARTLGQGMMDGGLRLVSGGTDNHLCLVDLTPADVTGKDAEKLLESVGLTVNKNSIPNEPRSPFVTSGIRVGSAAATTRGFTADDFYEVGQLIAATVFNAESEAKLADVRAKVDALLAAHPLYPELDY